MNEPTYAMVKLALTGIDVETATDEDILYVYTQIGFPPDAAQFYLNMINGVPEDWFSQCCYPVAGYRY